MVCSQRSCSCPLAPVVAPMRGRTSATLTPVRGLPSPPSWSCEHRLMRGRACRVAAVPVAALASCCGFGTVPGGSDRARGWELRARLLARRDAARPA